MKTKLLLSGLRKTEDGRVVELVGSQKPSAVVIYHAMEPPTKRVLFELGLLARRR